LDNFFFLEYKPLDNFFSRVQTIKYTKIFFFIYYIKCIISSILSCINPSLKFLSYLSILSYLFVSLSTIACLCPSILSIFLLLFFHLSLSLFLVTLLTLFTSLFHFLSTYLFSPPLPLLIFSFTHTYKEQCGKCYTILSGA